MNVGMSAEAAWAGRWQDDTLYLPTNMTIETLNGLQLHSPTFPSTHCVVDASELQLIDSVGVAALISLRTFADEQNVGLAWSAIPKILSDLLVLYDLNNKEMIE